MKKLSLLPLLFLPYTAPHPQQDHAQWSATAEQLDEKTYVLHIAADIEDDWHIYSQYHHGIGNTVHFTLLDSASFKGQDTLTEVIEPITEITNLGTAETPMLDTALVLKKRAEFLDTIRAVAAGKSDAQIMISYQICKDVCEFPAPVIVDVHLPSQKQ